MAICDSCDSQATCKMSMKIEDPILGYRTMTYELCRPCQIDSIIQRDGHYFGRNRQQAFDEFLEDYKNGR